MTSGTHGLATNPARLSLAALLLVMAGALAGFGPCDTERVVGPGGGGTAKPSAMSRLWPNEDGRTFDYAVTDRALTGGAPKLFPTPAAVPEVTMSQVAALLGVPPAIEPGTGSDYAFRLRFEGDMTTQSGVRTQNLVESLPLVMAPLRGGEAEFLARLARARPDLRARIARYAPLATTLAVPAYPNFIHGYGFLKGPQWIGSYGDVDTVLAWKFLESNVSVGHTFQQQLVPSLADDVFLKARVARTLSYAVPGRGTVRNCLEVHYLIDYGIMEWADQSGTITGYTRWIDYGRVIYAPDVGPVLDEERRGAFAGTPPSPGNYLLLLQATAVTPGGAAVAFR